MRATSTLTLLALAAQVDCDCECGYTVNASESENFGRFTEVVETDFLHVAHFQSGWIAQAYNVSPENSRGPYGKAAQVENVRSNIIASPYDWSGPGVRGPHPGLQLWNRASLLDIFGTNGSMIPMAEVVSARTDILYGSFRVGMMTTQISGTCGAFFFYLNDSQEIDMEFLSRQQLDNNGIVNLVIQSPLSADLGHVENSSPDFDEHSLLFSAGSSYNEYRFDWLSDRVDFYANGKLLQSTRENVPTAAGSIHLIHWSNGDPGWSGGPPKEDAALTISYVKAYFNSSSSTTTQKSLQNCQPGGQMCEIPTQYIAPDPLESNGNSTGKTFFFTDQSQNEPDESVTPKPSESRAANNFAFRWALPVVVWFCMGQWPNA